MSHNTADQYCATTVRQRICAVDSSFVELIPNFHQGRQEIAHANQTESSGVSVNTSSQGQPSYLHQLLETYSMMENTRVLQNRSNPISYPPIPDRGSVFDDKDYQVSEGVDAEIASNKDDPEEDQGADKGQNFDKDNNFSLAYGFNSLF